MSHGGTILHTNGIELENITRRLWVLNNDLFQINNDLRELERKKQFLLLRKVNLDKQALSLNDTRINLLKISKFQNLSRKFLAIR
jgi:hypothetical protein